MNLDREAMFVALETRLREVPGITTFSRIVRLWKTVMPEEHPAMFLAKGHETVLNRDALPPKRNIEAVLYIYTHREQGEIPSTQMNRILKDVEAVLERRNGERQVPEGSTTLGNVVGRCYITGVEADEGALGDQSVSIVTIEMSMP